MTTIDPKLNKIAVFIDGDNISYKWLNQILTEVKKIGNIRIAKVYLDCSTGSFFQWNNFAIHNGVELIHCPTIPKKNSVDIKLMLDIYETLVHNKTYNTGITTIVVASHDGDFRHIAPKIKQFGFKFYGIGSETASAYFKVNCDRFIKLSESDVDSPEDDNTSEEEPSEKLRKLRETIIRSFNDQSDEMVNISYLKDKLKQKNGYKDFNEKDWGCNSFTKFVDKYLPEFERILVKNGTANYHPTYYVKLKVDV